MRRSKRRKLTECEYEEGSIKREKKNSRSLHGHYKHGKPVEALWPPDGLWYKAQILEVSNTGERYTVQYDDGIIRQLYSHQVKEFSDDLESEKMQKVNESVDIVTVSDHAACGPTDIQNPVCTDTTLTSAKKCTTGFTCTDTTLTSHKECTTGFACTDTTLTSHKECTTGFTCTDTTLTYIKECTTDFTCTDTTLTSDKECKTGFTCTDTTLTSDKECKTGFTCTDTTLTSAKKCTTGFTCTDTTLTSIKECTTGFTCTDVIAPKFTEETTSGGENKVHVTTVADIVVSSPTSIRTVCTENTFATDEERKSRSTYTDIIAKDFALAEDSTSVVENKELKQLVDIGHEPLDYDSDKDPVYIPMTPILEETKKLTSNKLEQSQTCTYSNANESATDDDSDFEDDVTASAKRINLPMSFRKVNKYNKKFKCLYCKTFESKLARHLERKHKNEEEVQNYLKSTEPHSEERKNAVSRIRKRAHFLHNRAVIQQGEGTFLVERRCSENRYNAGDYYPCPECLGFYHRKSLRAHMKKCCSKPGSATTKMVKVFYQAFISRECSDDKFLTVLSSMSDDSVSQAVKNDSLILQFGRDLYESYEYSKEHHVSTKMREIGRVLLMLRQQFPTISISQVILERKFDEVVHATKELCKLEPDKKLKSTPSLALKVGHTMKRLAGIKFNEAIRLDDQHARRQAKNYLQLHTSEWSSRISKYALDALIEKKKAKALPLTADLQKIRKYLIHTIKHVMAKEVRVDIYSELVTNVLARVIIFNAKRGGEAGRMTITDFNKQLLMPNNIDEFNLTALEKKLSSRFRLIKIKGKRNYRVPVLLSLEGIKRILEHRHKFISDSVNQYIFLLPNHKVPLAGWTAMRRLTNRINNLEQPEAITTTNVRKYVATVSQVMDLKGNEIEWLANHMGHDPKVHKEYYRLPEATIQTAKIGKLLLAIEGGITKYSGKTLDDITDISDIEEDDDDDEDGQGGNEDSNEDDNKRGDPDNMSCDEEAEFKNSESPKCRIACDNRPYKHSRIESKRRAWTKEEKQILEEMIANRTGQNDKDLFKEIGAKLGRTWQQVKGASRRL